MRTKEYFLTPPHLKNIADRLQAPLAANYEQASISIVTCPDLRQAPFSLTTRGLSGDEKAADVGGQPNLFPTPKRECKWSLLDIARAMDMDKEKGNLLGAGAGPWHVVGRNCEMAANISWTGADLEGVENGSRIIMIRDEAPRVDRPESLDCALMINLFGSRGETGPVLKITAKGRKKGGEKSFTECIRKALATSYGDSQTITLGGAFVIKKGKTNHHIMPDFPPAKDLPFKDRKQLNNWLTYHDFDAPIVCLSVLHSADPGQEMGLRMEHTHCASMEGKNAGGHYHGDLDVEGEEEEEVEYEGYFNTAKVIYRVERPEVRLERDLHD